MTVTSVSAVAVSFRSVTLDASHTAQPAAAPAAASDTVELSQQAAAEARTSNPASRNEVLLKTLDADGDGVISKSEFTTGAFELLKHASVQFHHRHVGRGEGIEKRDNTWTARLEDVFTKVDANHDGSIDRGELQSALPATSQHPAPRPPRSDAGANAALLSAANVTVVSVAIRQYASVGQTPIAKV
jgi:hypothetical protein